MWSGPLRNKGLDLFNPESSEAAGDFGRAKLSPFDHSPHRSLSYAQHVRDLACSEEASLPARIRSECFGLWVPADTDDKLSVDVRNRGVSVQDCVDRFEMQGKTVGDRTLGMGQLTSLASVGAFGASSEFLPFFPGSCSGLSSSPPQIERIRSSERGVSPSAAGRYGSVR